VIGGVFLTAGAPVAHGAEHGTVGEPALERD